MLKSPTQPFVGTIQAWAHGAHFPEKPGQPGYSVSAWAMQNPETKEWEFYEVVSKLPNRWSWEASIRALMGAVEFVAEGSMLTIFTANQELAEMFESKFRRSNGSLSAGAEYAAELFDLIDKKKLQVRVIWKRKDSIASHLQMLAKLAAGEKRMASKAA